MHAAASTFHAGELAIQERVGVREQMAGAAAYIRDHMPDQHREFYHSLPFFFLGALDASGQPWATMLAADAGFIVTPDARTLDIRGGLLAGDPLQGQLRAGAHIGGLGLEPSTRRRNRVNGEIVAADEGALRVAVTQSFGNCPQYIQHRQHTPAPTDGREVQVLRGATLSAVDRELIARADTFFIASANMAADAGRGRGVDVSHRGGRPGFVRVDDDHTLTAPEFVGNYFFNTMGNLLNNPRAGLLFIDFENGDLLHIAVEGEIIWDGPQLRAFAGAEKLLRFHVREVVRNVGALPFRWTPPQPAMQNARTGSWAEADSVQAAAALSTSWRSFNVVDVVRESGDVRSFYLEPADGSGVASHVPGQFVSVRVPAWAGEGAASQIRSYTVSDAPDGRRYRISVKRQGVVSSWLHAHLSPGAQIELMGPGGDFTFEEGTQRPVVMLSAGIGITPMIAMLNGLLVNGSRTRHKHPIHFIHGAREVAHPFAVHLQTLAMGHSNLHLHVRLKRIDVQALKELLPFDDYDFYLCGPAGFMQDMYDGLRKLNVADERIRFEAFGPASVRRSAVKAASEVTQVAPVPVRFVRSGIEATWDGTHASLLDLAEANGIEAPSGCRSGLCGSCTVGLSSGEVEYTRACGVEPEAGQVLLCSTAPRAGSGPLALAL
ncbi:2Fe-2S iron-sulfur cluster binding domain-containing protein [Duganella sp. FT94W]|uniref:2Fe-2S iron-sulfur cluster binding domain-containing protein n=1 Tax=Duganella lactea TaxID=2692173 RepID=A0ABW9VC46_9BURK|nr:pyridoxamine 5'-phosphate oxidase family protein [Duganella lactea]MYM36405.1 2Fe-2S iron-sulfur cluster binding domain-containing protein [Duganella lactea]